ncbi:MAG: hypothetical protein ACYCSN_14715 [Acidobacteriaceae bacterium]
MRTSLDLRDLQNAMKLLQTGKAVVVALDETGCDAHVQVVGDPSTAEVYGMLHMAAVAAIELYRCGEQ